MHILHNIGGLVNSHFEPCGLPSIERKDHDPSKRPTDSTTRRALSKYTWHEVQKKSLKVHDTLLA